jgi:hypothetical protein
MISCSQPSPHWAKAAARVGAFFTRGYSDVGLSASDRELFSDANPIRFGVSREAALRLTARDVSEWIAVQPTEVLTKSPQMQGPVFLRTVRTIGKDVASPLRYTQWASAAEAVAAAPEELWTYQQSPDALNGPVVMVPLVSYPFNAIAMVISVSPEGEVAVVTAGSEETPGPDVAGGQYPMQVPADLLAQIQAVCAGLSLRSCIHSMQFLPVDGGWVLQDWNLRPPASLRTEIAEHPGLMDRALAHAFGLPMPAYEPFSLVQRHFPGVEITPEIESAARAAGFVVRRVQTINPHVRFATIGAPDEVAARLTQLETVCA